MNNVFLINHSSCGFYLVENLNLRNMCLYIVIVLLYNVRYIINIVIYIIRFIH